MDHGAEVEPEAVAPEGNGNHADLSDSSLISSIFYSCGRAIRGFDGHR